MAAASSLAACVQSSTALYVASLTRVLHPKGVRVRALQWAHYDDVSRRTELAKLRDNDFFGEASLMNDDTNHDQRANATIVCTSYCESPKAHMVHALSRLHTCNHTCNHTRATRCVFSLL